MNKKLYRKERRTDGKHQSVFVVRLIGSGCDRDRLGKGTGAAISRALADAGASIMLCSRSEAELERTKSEITRAGGKAHMIVADTSDRASCQRLTDSTVGHFGRVDVLVNNAGIDAIHPAEELTDEDWDRVMNTNLKGYFICSQVVARQMLAQGTGGSIINNSSSCSIIGVNGLTVYSATKGGVNQLTRVMAVEWATRGIRVNAIAPGYFNNIMQDATAEHEAITAPLQNSIRFLPDVLSAPPSVLAVVVFPPHRGAIRIYSVPLK